MVLSTESTAMGASSPECCATIFDDNDVEAACSSVVLSDNDIGCDMPSRIFTAAEAAR